MRNFVTPGMAALILSAVSALAGDAAPSVQPASIVQPVAAAQPPATAQPAAETIPDGDKIECRMMGAKTGSRLGARRDCRTKREWEDIRHQDARELERMQARDAFVRH